MLQLYEDLNMELCEQNSMQHIIRQVKTKVRDFLESKKPQDRGTLFPAASEYEAKKYKEEKK